jgi:hypothetical protein
MADAVSIKATNPRSGTETFFVGCQVRAGSLAHLAQYQSHESPLGD